MAIGSIRININDRVTEWLRRWTANPIQSPCVGSNTISVGQFLEIDELNSLSIKTDIYLILLLIHRENCQVKKFNRNNRLTNFWNSSEQLVKQPNLEKF